MRPGRDLESNNYHRQPPPPPPHRSLPLRPEEIPLKAGTYIPDQDDDHSDRETDPLQPLTPDEGVFMDNFQSNDTKLHGHNTDEEMGGDTTEDEIDQLNGDGDKNDNQIKSGVGSPQNLKSLLDNIEDEMLRESVEQVLVSKSRIELGKVLGKGE